MLIVGDLYEILPLYTNLRCFNENSNTYISSIFSRISWRNLSTSSSDTSDNALLSSLSFGSHSPLYQEGKERTFRPPNLSVFPFLTNEGSSALCSYDP